MQLFFGLFSLSQISIVFSQFSDPPSFAIAAKPLELSNKTIDVNISTGNVSATIRGLEFSFGRQFRGIPYAQPPVGALRFKYAQRMDPRGIVNATDYGAQCVQKPLPFPGANLTLSSEDCLFINVFTPLNVTANSSLPVFMFYHGGGHEGGNGNQEVGIFPNLVNRGPIILVSMNYRVGPFGFFTTRDSTAPGNWATSDWLEALSWVNRYIRFFGGDPNRITIGGQSAGAESVSAITMSPLARSMFSQVILESGSSFDASIMSYSERTRNTSEYLAIALNCSSEQQWRNRNFSSLITCLQNATADEIKAADTSLPSHRSKWSLVQDDKYLPDTLEALAVSRNKSVNVLCGNANMEWIFFENQTYMTTNVNSSRNTGSQLAKDLSERYEMIYYNNQAEVQKAAEEVYINGTGWSEEDHVDWEFRRLQLFSEMVFTGPVLRDASFYRSNGNTVFLYSLDWLSPNALPDVTIEKLRRVDHGGEMPYLYDTDCGRYNCTEGDDLLREYFSTAWVNFIKHGNPTPSRSTLPFRWLPMNGFNSYLSFTLTPSMQSDYHPDAKFWTCTAPKIDGYNGPFC